MTIESDPPVAKRPPWLAVGLLSASALAYEVLLMRLFSIIQWHHFAYMIISLALLGYGASGTFLALTQARLLANYRLALLANLALFGLSALPVFLLAQRVPFNPQELLWSWRQPLWLMLVYLLLSLPLFFAANAIALTLAGFCDRLSRVYAVDLVGAGIGSLGVILLLYAAAPLAALVVVSGLGLACVALAAWELRMPGRLRLAAGAVAGILGMSWLGQASVLTPSPYKDLSQALRVAGARIVAERHSPLGLLQVVESRRIPLRYAPGLSVKARRGPPAQLGVFSDGDSLGAITKDSGDPASLKYLDQLTSALPYHLSKRHRALILGAGTGMDILQARAHGVREIEAVELNPQIVELVEGAFGAYSRRPYSRPGVHLRLAEGRGYLAAGGGRYDLIQIAVQDALAGSAAGLYALSENYLYTVEALQIYLAHLQPGAYLAISRWLRLPPRDMLKLFATAIDALRRDGVEDPGRHLLLIRGWQTGTLLVKNGVFSEAEIEAAKAFCSERAFDLAWYPGISAAEVNRYNVLREPYFYRAARALLGGERAAFVERYKFKLDPATDDQPYFHQFFKWSTLGEIISLRGRGGLPLLEAGYPLLVATLIQAALASAVLIVWPLALARRGRDAGPLAALRWRVVVYFGTIGLAFLFLEIAFIQKFMLFLHHPLFAAAVVLASFLVFAGAGSAWAQRHAMPGRYLRSVGGAAVGILVLGVVYLLTLDALFAALMSWPTAAKIGISIGLIAPLAFLMGMPFPLALASLGHTAASLIPLAWGVNGCASVLSAVLATLLAVHLGFATVVLFALLLYTFAPLVFPLQEGLYE